MIKNIFFTILGILFSVFVCGQSKLDTIYFKIKKDEFKCIGEETKNRILRNSNFDSKSFIVIEKGNQSSRIIFTDNSLKAIFRDTNFILTDSFIYYMNQKLISTNLKEDSQYYIKYPQSYISQYQKESPSTPYYIIKYINKDDTGTYNFNLSNGYENDDIRMGFRINQGIYYIGFRVGNFKCDEFLFKYNYLN